MNKNGLLKPFMKNSFATRIRRIKKPTDIIIKEKIEPKNVNINFNNLKGQLLFNLGSKFIN